MNILIFGMTPTYGGVESFIMNYYRRLQDDQGLHFDFLCVTKEKIAYQDELLERHSRIFRITARSKDPFRFKKELTAFFDANGKNYDALWMNDNSLANIDYLKEAKRLGIRHRIMHCHNDRDMSSRAQAVLHRIHRTSIENLATDFWACSEEAADYCFSGRAREKAVVINNAIDLTEKIFDEEKRKIFRRDFGIENRFVIGNVGRLHFQKNQMFSIDILNCLVKNLKFCENNKPILILIGTGPDKNKLEDRIKELGLSDFVKLLGRQEDIQAALSAMDLFLFPSLFEGLGIAALEAELNGLTVLASDNVPKAASVNPNYFSMPLVAGAEKWAEEIAKLSGASRPNQSGGGAILDSGLNSGRLSTEESVKNLKAAGYDIETEAVKLFDRFMKM